MRTYQDALTALADPTRRRVLESLVEGPQPVTMIAASMPVSRPAVSQHLKVLKEAGLVSDERAGNRRLYSLQADGLMALRNYLDRFWDEALTRFKDQADRKGD